MQMFHNKSAKDVLILLGSSQKGLSSNQAKERKAQGVQEEFKSKKQGFVSKFFDQFFDFMIIILLLASAISITIGIIQKNAGDIADGCIILFIVIMNAIFGSLQEYKAEKSLEALGKLTQSEAVIIRYGIRQKIKATELVEGDIVLLEAGSIVPADLRLIECFSLKIDESSLTGESQEVEKNADRIYPEQVPIGERKNMAYRGTVVTCGRGLGVVVAIGKNTEFGKIALAIKEKEKTLSPLQKSIKDVGRLLTWLVLGVALITFIIEVFITSSSVLEAFLTAVAIAVAAIPESMPAVITIIMSLGVARLAKQKAIVKKLHCVETLGCCDVICSDKTGTITQNKMTVKGIFSNGKIQENKFSLSESDGFLIKAARYCCDATESGGNILGDPTEVAIVEFAKNFKNIEIVGKRTKEIPFTSKRKMMSVLIEENGKKMMYVKGGLDQILSKCNLIMKGERPILLNQNCKDEIKKANHHFCQKAMRVIAVACKPVNLANDFSEDGLIFLGLIAMIDPPRKEIAQAIKKCKKAGMRPVMITGDFSETALAIAKEVGLASDMSQVISGDEIASLSDKQLEEKIEDYSVFARVSPEDKMRIVLALKKKGHVVAMTGDGVNDAPSLKKADIGIGMGKSGTDVAKEVSDMIVTDDNFATIIVAVEEGRKIYQNIQKAVKFLFSANAAELLSMFIITLLFPSHVFLYPVQILFVNLITDSLPAIALGVENPESDLMNHPPRNPKKGLFANGVGINILVMGFFQTLFVVLAFLIGLNLFGPAKASTMGFYTLNIIQMFYLASMRTNVPFIKSKPWKNKFFLLAIGFCFALSTLFALTPLRNLLNLEFLGCGEWLVIAFFCLLMLIVSEIYKLIEKRVLAKKGL